MNFGFGLSKPNIIKLGFSLTCLCTGVDTIGVCVCFSPRVRIVSVPVLALLVELLIDINFGFYFLLLLNAMCNRLRNL